jgi:uncharacterized protein DUF4242
MMATAIRGPDVVPDPYGEREDARFCEDPAEAAEIEELPLDFFIGPNIPRACSHGYFPSDALKSLPEQNEWADCPPLTERNMPKYVIERDIPNIGDVSPDQVFAISQKSCSVLNNLGPKIQWLHSYVTQDKIYCVYIAPNEEMVREHAKQGGFPANRVSEVKLVIDPTSAEA